jgi:phosphoglycolate phosphatase
MGRIEAVLFDMEGTLVGFEWKLEEGEAALREAFAELGFPPGTFARDSYSGMWNRALRMPDGPVSEADLRSRLDPVYDRYDLDALSRWQLRPHALETVGRLRGMGLRVAVVSNIGSRALSVAVRDLGLADLVDHVFSRNDVRFMKPDGDGLTRALDRLGLTARQALFVGDSRTDVLAARAAGVRVAVIAGGESDRSVLEADPPDHYLASLAEVIDVLEVLEDAGDP